MTQWEPVYLDTKRKGLLASKARQAQRMLERCVLCPRRCEVNRVSGQKGVCRTGVCAVVSSYGPHFGEETPLVGTGGSGTIFFTHCNLLCLFCQNYEISHLGQGTETPPRDLAQMMLDLQETGCHNINFVTPSHVVPQILASLDIAADLGLRLPLVYNTGGYDAVSTLRLLEGVFDIYMPDFKFWDPQVAQAACMAPDYPEVARKALMEMHRQVGDLVLDGRGLARRGILLRHLVLPEDRAGTEQVMDFVAREICPDTYVNIMAQYRPCGRASEIPGLDRSPSRREYERAVAAAKAAGLKRLDRRERVFAFEWA